MRWVYPSEISGTVCAPPSKSMMIRAAASALLCEDAVRIMNASYCEDGLAALEIVEALGAQVTKLDRTVTIKGGMDPQRSNLDCNNSGLCMRLFAPIVALANRTIALTGAESLKCRPMGMMESPLRHLGAYCLTDNGFPPIRVRGPIKGGKVAVDGTLSSQFLTGLLTALPLCDEDSELTVTELRSKPYVSMTLSLLDRFGISISSTQDLGRFVIPGSQRYKRTDYSVEGDWSGAAFILAAGAVSGRVTVGNLEMKSLQADKGILDALELCGARLSISGDTVTVERDRLDSFEFDATDCPDLFPPLAALACSCKGRSVVRGVERIRHKESDRARALVTELGKIGARISVFGDRMDIEGTKLTGGGLDSHNDHRIAMAGAVAGLSSDRGVGIEKWQSVSKSYPAFFEDLKSVGGRVA